MNTHTWFLIETNSEYDKTYQRFEQVRDAKNGTVQHKEKMLLAFLINQYDLKRWSVPDVDPVELIKIRMEEFGYKSKDLSAVYGDKGTISKVLNYKQPLSLTMIRKFSKMLHIPADALTKEYAQK
ncbi:MAG: XRE family transcriptional regulator [Chitinophagaceae bacterium]|nr:XRE family transcriptional regulator [Chitinophagaceae bacterium]